MGGVVAGGVQQYTVAGGQGQGVTFVSGTSGRGGREGRAGRAALAAMYAAAHLLPEGVPGMLHQ